MTFDLVRESQNGNQCATLYLLDKFKPLLKKYANKLGSEDAYEDLLLDFIELIHSIQLDNIRHKDESHIVSYISTSIHSSYVKRLLAIIKQSAIISISDLSEKEVKAVDILQSTHDVYFAFEFPNIQKILNKNEAAVIRLIYYLGYTTSETACYFGVSRQAVNQMKRRALRKLRCFFADTFGYEG